MSISPIYFSSEEFKIRGILENINENYISLTINNIELFIKYINFVKNKIIKNKIKYDDLNTYSDNSLNQLFKYPISIKNFKENAVIQYITTDFKFSKGKQYYINIIPTHIIINKDQTWKMVFTITNVCLDQENNKYLFINNYDMKKIINTEKIINAYL